MTKGYEDVILPEMVKFSKENNEIKGIFQSLEKSEKYSDSKALYFSADNVNKMVFINSVAIKLFHSGKVKIGDEFILTFIGMKPNKEGNQEYMDFTLKVKRNE